MIDAERITPAEIFDVNVVGIYREALTKIREITADSHRERPYTALSQINQIARKALAQ